jgi:hypothetical protein
MPRPADILARWPSAYLAFARRRYGAHRIVGPDTEVMIEGFPRSANTFAVTAFQLAQQRDVRIAHHVHEAVHVRAAAERGVPVLLLVRRPEDAVVSALLRKPQLSMTVTARVYRQFHADLLALSPGFVVADFDQVTTDFGAVIRRLNARYGTGFAEFEHTPDNVERCFQQIDRHSRTRTGGELVAQVVARPSDAKHEPATALRERYRSQLASSDRARMEELYTHYRSLAVG